MSCRCNPGMVFIPLRVSAEELCSRVKGSPDGGLGDRRGLCTPRTHCGHPRAHLQLEELFCQYLYQSSVLCTPIGQASCRWSKMRYQPNGLNLLRSAQKLDNCTLKRAEELLFCPPKILSYPSSPWLLPLPSTGPHGVRRSLEIVIYVRAWYHWVTHRVLMTSTQNKGRELISKGESII